MSEKNIAKAAGAVSIGSLIVQAGGVLGQFVYAIWLTPSDFGLWATASASMALVGALLNAGEANAYLAGSSVGISGPFKRSRTFNYMLTAVGMLVAVNFTLFADLEVAAMITVLACGLPLQGRATMLIAAFIKIRSRSTLIAFQAVGTVVRLLIGIMVASIWASPLALALAYVSYSLVVVFLGQVWIKRSAPQLASAESAPVGSWSLRVDRAVHQVSQTLPNQIDYLTISIFAGAQVLGLYFFAYQATSAISAMLSSPLSKATMSELSGIERARRVPLVCRFLILIVALVGLGSALVSLIIQPLSDFLGERWQDVLAPLVILLSSLPARFVIPITEALNMVNAKWRRSIWINVADALGVCASAVIALVGVGGGVVTLAIFVTIWKVAFGNVRAIVSLRGQRLLAFVAIVVPSTLYAAIFAMSVLVYGYFGWLAFVAVLIIVSAQLIVFVATMMRARRR